MQYKKLGRQNHSILFSKLKDINDPISLINLKIIILEIREFILRLIGC